MNARAQIPERAKIYVGGNGILGEAEGRALYAEHKDLIDSGKPIDFVIGENVTHLSEKFLSAVLKNALVVGIKNVEDNIGKWTREEREEKLQEGRFSTKFDTANMDMERGRICGTMAHRFLDFVNPYNQFHTYARLSCSHLAQARPEYAEEYKGQMTRWKGKLNAKLGLG